MMASVNSTQNTITRPTSSAASQAGSSSSVMDHPQLGQLEATTLQRGADREADRHQQQQQRDQVHDQRPPWRLIVHSSASVALNTPSRTTAAWGVGPGALGCSRQSPLKVSCTPAAVMKLPV
jgi:hypothetical protein